MKKILHTIILPVLCGLVVALSGCDLNTSSDFDMDFSSDADLYSDTSLNYDFDTELKFAPVIEIRENFSRTAEELRAHKFDNLDFSKTEFDFPDIDSVTKLSVELFSAKSAQEIYDFFSETVDALMPGQFSEERKRNEIRFYDGEVPEGTSMGSFPTIEDYKLTDHSWPYIETDECFMDMNFGTLRWYDNGDFKRWRGEKGSPVMETMFGHGKQAAFITDMNCTDKYELTNGEISVKDAAEFVNNYLATMNFSIHETLTKSKVYAVSVMDIGNGKYGYNFLVSYEYKNISFDHCGMQGGQGSLFVENDYDKHSHGAFPGQIGMIETDKIYQCIEPVYRHILNEEETYTSIITLENAAETVGEFYSASMNFSVKNVGVVYLDDSKPCWKFLMYANGEAYNTFVDMHTGEVHVYIEG